MPIDNVRLRFHCVSVHAGEDGCEPARALEGVRLLSPEAPRLPLAGCTQPDRCNCVYRHFDDRRVGTRRARDRAELADPWSATERRRSGGRRTSD